MAHAGEEIRLGPAGRVGGGQGIPQKLLLAGLLLALAVQKLHQIDGQHVVVKGVLHRDHVHGEPVVLPVVPDLLHLHVDLLLPGLKPAQNLLPPEGVPVILLVGGIDHGQAVLHQIRVGPLPLDGIGILLIHKQAVGIPGQIQAHDQGVCGVDRGAQKTVFQNPLLLLGLFQAHLLRDIRKYRLNHLQTVAVDDPAHDHADPHLLTVPSDAAAAVGHILAV